MAEMGLPVTFVPISAYYWPWVANKTMAAFTDRTKGIVALRGEMPVAAVAFDGWSYTGCMAHIVLEDPFVLRHGFLEEVFNYVFNTCNRKLIIGVTPGSNAKALKLNKHMGFTEIYRIRDGYDEGIDFVVQELRREDCRWLKAKQKEAA